MANCKQMLMGGGKPRTPKVRDERIDSVKYWLIVLVIAGHVFLRKEFSNSTACVVLWKWIYIFHMPLFVFISGYFSRKKDKKNVWPSIWKLLEPLILFQTIVMIIISVFKGSISIIDYFTPWYSLWYLLSLIWWRLMLQIIPDNIINNTKLIIISTFCISILAGFLPFNKILSLQRTLAFMPFFFLGYCMKNENLFLSYKYKPLCYIFVILTFVIPIYFPYLGNLTHQIPYDYPKYSICRILVFCFSIPISIAFINICPNKTWFAKQGRLTMQYYIYHSLIIAPIILIAKRLNYPMNFMLAIILILILVVGISIFLSSTYFTKLTNPSSLLNNR